MLHKILTASRRRWCPSHTAFAPAPGLDTHLGLTTLPQVQWIVQPALSGPPVCCRPRCRPHSSRTRWARTPRETGPCWRRSADRSFRRRRRPRSPASYGWPPWILWAPRPTDAVRHDTSTRWITDKYTQDCLWSIEKRIMSPIYVRPLWHVRQLRPVSATGHVHRCQGWNSQFRFWSQRIYNGGRICYISYMCSWFRISWFRIICWHCWRASGNKWITYVDLLRPLKNRKNHGPIVFILTFTPWLLCHRFAF